MRGLAVLCLAACNQVYGLQETRSHDGSFFDVREDFTCPPIGDTPVFSPVFTQLQAGCTAAYTESREVAGATAFCNGQIAAGPIDGPFVAIPGLETVGSTSFVLPRLAPEGLELFFRENPTGGRVHVWQRTDGHMFEALRTLTPDIPFPSDVRLGTPTRGPLRRMLIGSMANLGKVDEIEIAPSGSSTTVRSHDAATLGVTLILGAPNMTPDGLRMVFPARIGDMSTASSHMMYSDRQSIADPFGTARVLTDIPFVADNSPFLIEGCSRLYTVTTSPSTIVWAQRQR